VLVATELALPGTVPGIVLILLAIAGFLIVPTFAIKKFTRFETFYIISILKTRRLAGFIRAISRPGLWDALADFGLIIGFGTLAVDYLYGRKKTMAKRIAIDLGSAAALFALFFVLFGLFFVANNPALYPTLALFSLGFALGGLMLFTIVSLAWQAFDIFAKLLVGKMPCPGVAPVIPGVQMPNLPAFLTPPLYVWGAFLIILAVHEFSHGALMQRAKVKIKSVGIIIAGLLPIGAFVEPDEKQLVKKPSREQLRIYAIGPASNAYSIAIFLAIFLVAAFAVSPFLSPKIEAMQKSADINAVIVTGVLEDYELCGNTIEMPAKGLVEQGWILRQYNGIDLNTLYDFSVASSKSDKNVSMVFETQTGAIVERAIGRNSRGEIGIETSVSYVAGKEPTQEYIGLATALNSISVFFSWLLLLSFALAMINFLPMDPFDGGKIAKIMMLPYFSFMKMGKKETEKFIGRLMLWIVLALLLLNALPLFL
jgi:membrane-associated protease RseP (regulator of RpoE activity)